MHDAMGVRRETGKQAVVIKNLAELFEEMGKDIPDDEKLKVFVGHTPLQVIMGAILGVIVGCVFYGIIG
jgi:acid phosphatase family membrane protein YuiD